MDTPTAEEADIAERFATRRTDLGLTQSKLAEQAGVSRHLVSDVENGKAGSISLGNLVKIARQLGLTIRAFPGIPPAEPPRGLPEDRHIEMLLSKYYYRS